MPRALSSKQDESRAVPLHLRNAPTKLMKQLDYGKGYRYAHDEEEAYAAGETYFPDGMPEVSFYEPTEQRAGSEDCGEAGASEGTRCGSKEESVGWVRRSRNPPFV